MDRARPPRRLPAGYAPVWRALARADREARSRQELAARLGVSTSTLQRILVRGDVPRFTGAQPTRVVRAWTRTLTRMARALGAEPRAWIEGVGIRWDDAAQSASQAALRPGAAQGTGGRGRSRAREAPWRDGAIAIARISPFADPIPALDGASFLEVYARRTVGAIEPSLPAPAFVGAGEPEALRGLERKEGAWVAVFGATATVPMMRTAAMVAIPGWRVRTGTVAVRAGGDAAAAQPPSAREALDPRRSDPLFLVVEGGTAHAFLRGQCRYPDARLLIRGTTEAVSLARELARAAEAHRGAWVALMADSGTCDRVLTSLRDHEAFGRTMTTGPLPSAAGELPAHRLGVAVRRGDRALLRSLRAARDLVLFGSSEGPTADLYADLLAEGAPPLLEPFRSGRSAFAEALARRLLDRLRARDPEGAAAEARRRLPRPWRRAAGQALAGGSPASSHCRSCATSLLDAANVGASDRYCRFCSDPHGRLRPRREVEEVIARWMEHWQGDLAPEEARRRARVFMQAMPAWNEN